MNRPNFHLTLAVMGLLLVAYFAALPAAGQTDSTVGVSDSAANPYAWAYEPRSIQVGTGDTVTWVNDGIAPHTATGDGFDSGNLEPGESFQWAFTTPGTYPFYCTLHPWMLGSVVVTDAGASSTSGGDDAAS